MSSYFRERRAEILGPRLRRPKTGDRVTLVRYQQALAEDRVRTMAKTAALRLARVLGIAEINFSTRNTTAKDRP